MVLIVLSMCDMRIDICIFNTGMPVEYHHDDLQAIHSYYMSHSHNWLFSFGSLLGGDSDGGMFGNHGGLVQGVKSLS